MIGTRYITKDRKPLIDLLPLSQPLVLFVDPSDACNSKCSFCPTGDHNLMKEVGRPLQQMNMTLYKTIIDDLDAFETKIKVLRLYLHGEPLLNKNFCDMVSYAKKSNKIETVDTTTNGILLNPELNMKLIYSGIDRINISVNGVSSQQYLEFAKTKIDFDKYVKNIRHLCENRAECYVFIKINGDTISKEDEETFLKIFEPMADAVAIERSMNCWNDFKPDGFKKSNESLGIYGQQINKPVDICPYVFYGFAIQSNGAASVCFLDWNFKMIFGNAIASSIKSLWNSNELYEIRKMMLNKERYGHPICGKCDQLLKGMPENLDPYVNELLKIYI